MYNPTVDLWDATVRSALICATVATQCRQKRPRALEADTANQMCRTFYREGHHSVLEFAYATLHIQNVSRAFMAQITRHRHFSFICSSQHYQDYSNYQIICNYNVYEGVPQKAIQVYKNLLEKGEVQSEARMVLPECMAVNMFISGNARAWADMLRKRLCKANTLEMYTVAEAIHAALQRWFPAVFTLVGPDCTDEYMQGCRENERCKND